MSRQRREEMQDKRDMLRVLISLLVSAGFLFILPVAGPGKAHAAGRQLRLTEAVRLALQNNYEIKAFENSLAAGKEDIGIARSPLLPKIAFEERFMRTDNPTYAFMAKLNQGRFASSDFAVTSLNNPKAINDFQTSLSFEQLLFSRSASLGLKMAKKEYSAQGEDYAGKKEEVAVKVIRTYFSVMTAKEYRDSAEKALADSKEHLRIAELRYKSGLGLYSDTLRASTTVTGSEQKLVSAGKNLNVARKALGLLLGTDEAVDVAGEQMEIPLMNIDYYNKASLSRKDIRSMEARNENAKNSIRFAESAYLPSIGIGGAYQMNDHSAPGSEGESWQVAAFLRWNLFDGTKREHERAKAKFRAAESEEGLKGLKQAISFKVYEAYLGVGEAKKNAELAAAALRTAEEGRRLVKVRYENSLSPIIDLLDAQVSLDHARAGLVARENEYRTAIADLSYESGTILKDLKIEE